MRKSSTPTLKLTDKNVHEAAQQVADFLRRGYAIIFPTDTVYGLGVDALNKSAVERLIALKRRPSNKPIPLFVESIEMAHEVAFIDARQEEILKKLWPGPFTFVLEKKDKLGGAVSAGTSTVGLRIPQNDFCQALLKEFAGPITASSANISSEQPLATITEIVEQFKVHSASPDFIVDAGPLEGNPCTVIDIRSEKARILRMKTTPAAMKSIFEAGIQ